MKRNETWFWKVCKCLKMRWPGTELNRRRQPPKEPPISLRLNGNELKSQRFGLLLKLRFRPFLEEILLLSEHAFVVGLSRGEQVKNDASEFVGSGNICLGGAESGAHTAIVLAQKALAAMERLSRHAERGRGTVVYLAGPCQQNLSSADIVVGTQAQPGSQR